MQLLAQQQLPPPPAPVTTRRRGSTPPDGDVGTQEIRRQINEWKNKSRNVPMDEGKVKELVVDSALCYQFAHRAKYMTCLGVSHNSNNVNDDDNEDANDLNINSSIDDQLFREEEESSEDAPQKESADEEDEDIIVEEGEVSVPIADVTAKALRANPLPKNNEIDVRLILDKTSIEIFFNQGETVMTEIFFMQKPIGSFSVKSENSKFEIENLLINELNFN